MCTNMTGTAAVSTTSSAATGESNAAASVASAGTTNTFSPYTCKPHGVAYASKRDMTASKVCAKRFEGRLRYIYFHYLCTMIVFSFHDVVGVLFFEHELLIPNIV